jgi:hypothetical protein
VSPEVPLVARVRQPGLAPLTAWTVGSKVLFVERSVSHHFERTSTVLTPFPTTQVRAYTGPVQYFDGGLMLYTTETSGQHRILALGVSPVGGPWRAWPDPPE